MNFAEIITEVGWAAGTVSIILLIGKSWVKDLCTRLDRCEQGREELKKDLHALSDKLLDYMRNR